MKPIKWTATDEKRAREMGWQCRGFALQNEDEPSKDTFYEILHIVGGNFASNRMAAEWVVSEHAHYHNDSSIPNITEQQWKTMNKAILLCCVGGNP